MNKSLPARPSLDHLRRQAKALLASLAAGDKDAIAAFQHHLPAAAKLSPTQVREAGFRLADAQSAIARKSGFAAWPQLARHVDQLRALEGAWSFARLEVDGNTIPPQALSTSRILIDGDRFRTESPDGPYEGVFNIDVETTPHHIDIEFIAGPEAGNTNRGIFRIEADQLEICLDTTGASRPADFRTAPNTGHAYETLTRTSAARPDNVTGGTPPPPPPHPAAPAPAPIDTAAFAYVPSETLSRLQGVWTSQELVLDGKPLPGMMCKTGLRQATNNELKISFGGMVMIHALVRIDESTSPISVDYYNLSGKNQGALQHGIMEWRTTDAAFCMSAPGHPRPTTFDSPPGSGRTLSVWRPKK